MITPRLILMRELLADTGLIYVHLDWRVGHHVKVVMDEVFEKIISEMTCAEKRQLCSRCQGYWLTVRAQLDILYFYTKREDASWENAYKPYDLRLCKSKVQT